MVYLADDVHVISRKKLVEAARKHGDLGPSLDVWFLIAKKAHWQSLDEVRLSLPSADGVNQYTVFKL